MSFLAGIKSLLHTLSLCRSDFHDVPLMTRIWPPSRTRSLRASGSISRALPQLGSISFTRTISVCCVQVIDNHVPQSHVPFLNEIWPFCANRFFSRWLSIASLAQLRSGLSYLPHAHKIIVYRWLFTMCLPLWALRTRSRWEGTQGTQRVRERWTVVISLVLREEFLQTSFRIYTFLVLWGLTWRILAISIQYIRFVTWGLIQTDLSSCARVWSIFCALQAISLLCSLSCLHDSSASHVSGKPLLLRSLFQLRISIGVRSKGEREALQTAQGVLGMKGVSSLSCEPYLTQNARGQRRKIVFGRTYCLCSCADIVQSNAQGRYIWTDRSIFAIVWTIFGQYLSF